MPFENPTTGKEEQSDLIPDALFGLEYRHCGKSTFRFFVVEADRGTEPSRASTFNRKSHLRSLLQYREYVGRGLYKAHLGLTASLVVLNVTRSETTMANMIRLALQISPGGNTYQLFRCARQFSRYFKPTPPALELLTAPWVRARFSDFQIDQP